MFRRSMAFFERWERGKVQDGMVNNELGADDCSQASPRPLAATATQPQLTMHPDARSCGLYFPGSHRLHEVALGTAIASPATQSEHFSFPAPKA